MILADQGVIAVTGTREKPVLRLRPATPEQEAWVTKLYRVRYVNSKRWYTVSEASKSVWDRADRLGFQIAVDPALGEDQVTVRMPLVNSCAASSNRL